MTEEPFRYVSADEDSGRWHGFAYRPGDIVISTRSKSGTTWMQMICALLVFQTPELPAPLASLSPWLDWLIAPRDEVFARLEAQDHRRFVKTHTPLDGIPLDARATYIVVGRNPLDMAVSLYHQGDNINRARVRELIRSAADGGGPEAPEGASRARRPLRDWLMSWIDANPDPREETDSLPGVMWHLRDAWARQADPGLNGPTVVLVRYEDLCADLAGHMRDLAAVLGIDVPEDRWPELVKAATFDEMRVRAARQVPDPAGVLKDPEAFFRRGSAGAAREVLTAREIQHYYDRARELASPGAFAWLHPEVATHAGLGHQAVAGW